VGVGQQNRIELGERIERYPGARDPAQKSPQCRIEVGVGQQALARNLN
jgi:hypothetical protein